MKCPKCGTELKKGNMYCEVCGEEIHIVPDFEPEIENSIEETLSTVAMEVLPSTSGVEEDNLSTVHSVKKHNKKSRIIIWGSIVCFVLLLIGAIIIGSFIYKDNSAAFQETKATEEYNNKHYAEAAKLYENAVLLEEDNLNYRIELADCYMQMGENDKAEEVYLYIISLEQQESNFTYIQLAYAQLVYIYESEEKYDVINNLLMNSNNEIIQNDFSGYMAKNPEFSHEAGEYDEVIPLKLIGPSFGKIYYTLDGSAPGKGSLIYTAPIFLKKGNYTVRAVYINDYGISSNIVSSTYEIKAEIPPAPSVAPDNGSYDKPQLITVDVPENCNVYYTTDGSAPTENSSIYGEPIPMPLGDSNYKFASISKEGVSGDVVQKTYHLAIKSKYGPTDAINNVRYRLVEINRLLDAEGNLENMSGKNIYVYNCLRYIDDKTLYFIYEYYQEGNFSRNMTGNVFAVDVMEGRVYKATKNEDGNYSIEPI